MVTPAFNGAPTIGRTLASVRDQDYPGIEHVVVDGGSTDGTQEILRQAGVRFISEPDDGLADAMNKGIAMASGDWVGWLNADDVYLPGAFRAVGDAAAGDPGARWITGRCPIVDGEGVEIRRPITAYKNWLLRHYTFGLYLTQNFVSCPATFMRRDALAAVGPIDKRYRYSMDYDLFLRLARSWDPVILDRDLATFTMEEGSLSMSGFESQFAEHLEVARRHGGGHRAALVGNRVMSTVIVSVYQLMRRRRRGRQATSAGPSGSP